MNKKDRDNLNYIMSLDDEQFDIWLESIHQDDIDYAMELIRQARSEYLLEEMELMELTDSDDHTEAKNIIRRIMKK